MARIRRTRASRRWNTAWNRFWLFPGAAALGLVVLYSAGRIQTTIWLAGLVLVAGGAVAGVLAARDKSIRGPRPALLAPIPILILAGLVMLSVSESTSDLALTAGVLATALVLFDVPLAAAFRYTSDRGRENLINAGDSDRRRLEGELDAATDHGRSAIVVREYRADADGRAHLEFDTTALRVRGYPEVSVEHVIPSATQVATEFALGVAGESEARIIASFGRDAIGLANWKAQAQPASAKSRLMFGCLSAGLIVAWTIVGVAAMVIGFLVIGAVSPGKTGDPLASVPPLAGLGVAFVGSILSIRWLRTRR